MGTRLELDAELRKILFAWNPDAGIYYQPPASVHMVYPCIRYEYENPHTMHADNIPYLEHQRYTITVIDRNPDSTLPDLIRKHFPYCTKERVRKADNLYHFPLTLFY